ARRRYQAATADAATAVARFSPIALGCVIAIVATGTYQAWRAVGTFGALFGTTYGRLLLVKIGALCCLIALGNLARVRLRQMRDPVAALVAAQSAAESAAPGSLLVKAVPELAAARGGGRGSRGRRNGTGVHNGAGDSDEEARLHAERASVTLRKLRWSVMAEAFIAIGVLVITAILVNTPTARESYHPPASASAAFDTGGPGGKGTVSVVVTPDRLGPNQVRLSLTDTAGRPYRPAQVQASLSLPDRDLGPLPVALSGGQHGVYLSAPVDAAFTGQWQLRVTIRSDAFDETTVAIPFPVR
ncbi:MAG TPA: FixH family protein, partial [Streptosporangiaceae bacterium]|nr:FixH family protein [Streptosporangiaceae bacterium]